MVQDVQHLLPTIIAVARDLASLAPSAMESRSQLAASARRERALVCAPPTIATLVTGSKRTQK
jgi:hypothetical protein